MIYDVCVIGGGASGLAAAVSAAREGASVLVIERLEKVGKKILATGNGKCNLTNGAILRHRIPADAYRSRKRSFPMEVLNAFDASDTLAFFKSMGLYTKDRDGYIYPLSGQAATVAELLRETLADLGTAMATGETVQHIQLMKNGSAKDRFLIKTDKNVYRSRRLILAAGGCSSKKLGSDGSGYGLCKSLGHRIVEPVPALCGLHCQEKYFKDWAGIRLRGRVQLTVDGRMAAEDEGEIQLTAYGISGIPVFQVSRYGAYGLAAHRDVRAILDFMPDMDRVSLRKELAAQHRAHPQRSMEMILSGFMNKKLAAGLLKIYNKNSTNQKSSSKKGTGNERWDSAGLDSLAALIKHLEVHITDTNGFEQSQVTAGGVDTGEIDARNLSSRLVPGLYITGELLDVDGICGGYNLQWAWATGVLAGKDAGRKCHD